MSLSYDESISMLESSLPVSSSGHTFWRSEEPIMNQGVVVKGGMWEHQLKWWRLSQFIKVLVGGYGAGKTMIGCKRIISLALENAPCPVALTSPTFPIARETTIVTLQQLLRGKRSLYGRAFWWRYNGSVHEFRLRHRGRQGRILILSGDNPLSLRGPNLAAAGIDEPFIQDKEVLVQMVARVRHPDAKIKELFLTGTPEQLNWGYDLCIGEDRDNQDVGVVHASTRLNKSLGEDYVQRLESIFSEKAAKAYIEGHFINLTEGMVYYGFDPSVNVVENPFDTEDRLRGEPIPKSATLGVGMDFNVNPMAAVVFAQVGDHMHFFDELELPNADTEFMCEVLRESYGDRLEEVYPDATGSARTSAGGRTDHWYLEAAGFTINVYASNPRRKDRYNAVNGKLSPKKGPVSITISPRCVKLRKYLHTYSYELMIKQQKFSHLLDALGYPVAYLFPVDRARTVIYRLEGG